jgi:hypothetical protein
MRRTLSHTMSGVRVSRKESGGDVEGRQHKLCCASDGGMALRARRAGGEPKPPEAAPVKSRGGERSGERPGETGSGERREDEHVRTTADASKDIQMASKLRIGTRPWDKGAPAGGPSARELPARGPGGARCKGGVSSSQALARNWRTCRLDTDGLPVMPVAWPREGGPQAADTVRGRVPRGTGAERPVVAGKAL